MPWWLPTPVNASGQCLKVGEKRTVYGVTEVCRPVSGGPRWVKNSTLTTLAPTRPTPSTKAIQPKTSRTEGTLATSTTAAATRGTHGKLYGRYTVWESADKRFDINIYVGRERSGLEVIYVAAKIPKGLEIDPACSAQSPPISQIQGYFSEAQYDYLEKRYLLPGSSGTYTRWDTRSLVTVPGRENLLSTCDARYVHLFYWFDGGRWQDAHGNSTGDGPQAANWAKFTFRNLRTGEIFESPAVLVETSVLR